MRILDFKKTANSEGLSLDTSSDPSAPVLKALPPLAVLPILTSPFLRNLYRFFYCFFAAALLIALVPYIADNRSVLIQNMGWFSLLLAGYGGLWFAYKRQCTAIPAGSLACENGLWVLWDGRAKANYLLAGEVLCWPWLIIMPLKNVATGHKRYLLLSGDALKPADQARLRTWLRACLKPKG